MTSPPRRPIISLKFKKPDTEPGEAEPVASAKPVVPPAPAERRFEPLNKAKTVVHVTPAFKSSAASRAAQSLFKPVAPAKATPAPKAAPAAKSTPAPKADPAEDAAAAKPKPNRRGPAISPDLFKAAVKAAGVAIQSVVADPEWKSEDLLHQYQTAKEQATSTNKQQAKLVSTVATRRHARDIEQADVENAAMRAAYAAALVALVEGTVKDE
jgi:flagellar biosynthesis/type III secretory pathway protein FliH